MMCHSTSKELCCSIYNKLQPFFWFKIFLSALVYQLIQLTVVIHFLFCALSIFAIQYTNFKLIRHLKANKQDFIGWHKFNTVYKILYMYITTNKIA